MNKLNQSLRCRTCTEVSGEETFYHPLSEYFPEYKRTLTDLLFYICHIDDKMELIAFPTEMCDSCTQRLRDAYNFALQAQRVNKELLAMESRHYSNSLDNDTTKEDYIELLEEQDLCNNEQNCALEIEILDPEDSLIQTSMNFMAEESKKIESKDTDLSDSDFDMNSLIQSPSINNCIEDVPQQNKSESKEVAKGNNENNAFNKANGDFFKCEKCDKKYKLKNSLRYHIKRIHSVTIKHESNETEISDLVFDHVDPLIIQSDSENCANNLPQQSKVCKTKHQRGTNNKIKSDEFDCNKCNEKFKLKRDLIDHIKNHHSVESEVTEESILCKICGELQVSFVCLWCGHKFSEKKRFEKHMARHGFTEESFEKAISILKSTVSVNGSKQINCKLCKKQFSTISALRIHLLKSHRSNADSIQYYSIMNSLGFELHIDDSETGTDDENNDDSAYAAKYTCEICTISFKRKHQLAKHQQANHMPEFLPLKCDRCVFKTVSQDILEHHKKTQCYNEEKKFNCIKCSFKFMWKENLKIHQKIVHETNDKIQECKYCVENHFKCEKCNRKFKLKRHLIDHIENRHSDKIEKSEKPILCTICGKWFSSINNLKSHMRSHSNETFYKCDFCEQEFKYSTDLTKHKRKHTGEKPYNCNICGSSFRVASNFTIHMRRHSGERPYKCSYCGKGFIDSHNLKIHIRTHTGDRPYVCGDCGRSYITGSHLRKHCRKSKHSYENMEKP